MILYLHVAFWHHWLTRATCKTHFLPNARQLKERATLIFYIDGACVFRLWIGASFTRVD